MGWYGNYESPSKVKEEILRELPPESYTILKIASTNYGRHLWIAAENPKTTERFILFFLMNGSRGSYAYKPMDESMGPYEYDCPLALLNLVESSEPVNEYAKNWRAKVRAFHAKKSRAFTAGQKVTIFGEPYTIEKKYNKASWLVRTASGELRKAKTAIIETPEIN